jgi:CheY-like chemotaxis protein
MAELDPWQVGELQTCEVFQSWRTLPVHGSNDDLTVLVLDDHERMQAIWSALLGAAGIRHIGAHDIISAKDVVGSRHIDLVVIDEHLADPDESGSGFAIWLREATDPSIAAMPILACTSDQSPAIRERLRAAGAAVVIDKPIEARLALLHIQDLVQPAASPSMRHEGQPLTEASS